MQRDQKTGHWKKITEGWQKSRLSQRDYCIQRDVSYSVFRYWYRKLKSGALGDVSTGQVRAIEVARIPVSQLRTRRIAGIVALDMQGIIIPIAGCDASVMLHGHMDLDRLGHIIAACAEESFHAQA